jgi:CubicO group peptidase (beta-lactamase class C family)
MKERVAAVMEAAVAQGKIVGAELIVMRHSDLAVRRTAGFFDREAGVPMMEDAIYRLASVTKPIVAAAALAMVDKGHIRLSDRVSDYLDYFTPSGPDGRPAEITIHHLLTHTAGLGYDYSADPEISTGLSSTDHDFRENFSRVARQPLQFTPGTGWNYSVAIDVLGAVLSKVQDRPLEGVVRDFVTGPLGLVDCSFQVSDRARLAKPYADGETGAVVMQDPHDVRRETGEVTTFSPSRIFSERAFQSGGAGMAGTAMEVARFLDTLRQGGGEILKPETVALGFSNQIGDLPRDVAGQRFGYFGAIVDDPVAADSPSARGTINWGGVYGHSWLIDPLNAITIVSMSNTALEGCIGRYPKDVIRAVYDDLT